jgi:hypothetical protein
VKLDVLSRLEARDLLAHRLGAERLAAEPDAVDELISLSAQLPLALSILAVQASIHPGHPLSMLTVALGDSLPAGHP